MFKLSEAVLMDAMNEYINDCDTDELARLAEQFFGGKCHYAFNPENTNKRGAGYYEFEPNDNYNGYFNEEVF